MKKAIISISLIMAIIFVFSACSSVEYVDTPVTIEVTDENGEKVTDKNGEVVTEVVTVAVTNENGKEVTDNDGKVVTEIVTERKDVQSSDKESSAQSNTVSGSTNNNSDNTTASGKTDSSDNGTTESTSAKKTDNDQTTTGKQTTTKNQTTTTKQTTTKKQTTTTTTTTTTTKPTTTDKAKKRDVTITVNLPYYNDEETELTVYYRVDGDKKDTELEKRTVKLDDRGKKETFKIEKVKGEVYVYIELDGIAVASYSNSVTIDANKDKGEITPITGIEIIDGGML